MEDALQRLSVAPPPLVRELPRRPGQKESRWAHVLGGAIVEPPAEELAPHAATEPLSVRVQRLEEQVATLTEELQALKTTLGA